jgi:DNA-binding transcriptional MerR regulator
MKETEMEDEFFTIAEVAEKYKVHHQTVRTWIKTGALTARALPAGKKKIYRVPWSSL